VPSPQDLLALYLDELQRHHYSKALHERSARVMPLFFSHLRDEGVRDIRGANEAHLLSFARRLKARRNVRDGQPLSLSTQASYMVALRSFFNFLERRMLILRNPAREVKLRYLRPTRRFLSEAEARRLMDAPLPNGPLGLRDRAVLETFYGTGIRLRECVRLDLQDLDLKERTLLVRNGKGKKDRMVPVPGRAAEALARYLDEARPDLVRDPQQGALFLTRVGRRLGSGAIQKELRLYAQTAGIAGAVTPHVLRHTCATHLLQGGASVRHVQEILGHQTLNTTVLYTHVVADDLKQVLARAHPREWAYRRAPRK
jgi:integrase/recombinase XerD